jgi:predicted RND superfamily exporter protein
MQNVPVRIAKGLSKAVTRFPKATVMAFVIVAVVSASVIPGLRLYLSFYQLIPPDYHDSDDLTSNYYDRYTELNRDFGGDNWDFFVFRADNVTDVDVVREMNAVADAVTRDFEYVQGTFSLAELVKIVNYLATGRYQFPADDAAGTSRSARASTSCFRSRNTATRSWGTSSRATTRPA